MGSWLLNHTNEQYAQRSSRKVTNYAMRHELSQLCCPWNLRQCVTESYGLIRIRVAFQLLSGVLPKPGYKWERWGNVSLKCAIVTRSYEHDMSLTGLMRDICSRGSDEKSCHSCLFLHHWFTQHWAYLHSLTHTHSFLHTRPWTLTE